MIKIIIWWLFFYGRNIGGGRGKKWGGEDSSVNQVLNNEIMV